jgi:hypothetical protein
MASERFEFLRQMVFQTNLGLIRLGRDGNGELFLRHTLRSQAAPGSVTFADGTLHHIPLTPSTLPPPELTVLFPDEDDD